MHLVAAEVSVDVEFVPQFHDGGLHVVSGSQQALLYLQTDGIDGRISVLLVLHFGLAWGTACCNCSQRSLSRSLSCEPREGLVLTESSPLGWEVCTYRISIADLLRPSECRTLKRFKLCLVLDGNWLF